jgi:hypothetical protein
MLILLFSGFAWLPEIAGHPVLLPSFLGWSLCLIAWLGWLAYSVRSRDRILHLEFVPRKQHYIQATLQISVFVYWGWYSPQVYEEVEMILAQIAFAYVFDMLLSWSRRDSYVLGFGPFPIIFSTNLFLWFRDDWFYLQFLMVAVGFLGKEFVRWTREGKRVHIFNPAAFSLGIFSLALIVTGATDLTWGPQIASTLELAPNIYLFLFVIGLIVMYFFSITLISAFTAATLFGLSALYMQVTGVPYFLDSEIPITVFLGLHLLVTDPSTSPRSPSGKMVFGVLYGFAVFALYELLGQLGVPTFYDKLLCIPLLNLSVQRIDRLVRSFKEQPLLDRLGLLRVSRQANLVHMAVWIGFFATMTAIGSTDGRHTGDSVPFWEKACQEGRRGACDTLVLIESGYCGNNAGWACNELGVHFTQGTIRTPDPRLAQRYFSQACETGFREGCFNLGAPDGVTRGVPRVIDLRALLREGKHNLLEMPEVELYRRACDHGWTFFACEAPSI